MGCRYLYLSIRLHTTEQIIGTPKGVVVVQSIRRKPEDPQWDAELIKSLVGTVHLGHQAQRRLRSPGEVLELPEPVSIEVGMLAGAVDMKPHCRRVYLLEQDVEKLGYTTTCKTCNDLRLGFDGQGLDHSEKCRLRIV